MLKNLNIAKKALNDRVYLIVTILKLRPNNKFNLKFYKRVQNDAMILYQNLGLFLTLFLSDFAGIEDVMHIIYFASHLYQAEDLQKFTFVKRYCIIQVLKWLKIHNFFIVIFPSTTYSSIYKKTNWFFKKWYITWCFLILIVQNKKIMPPYYVIRILRMILMLL